MPTLSNLLAADQMANAGTSGLRKGVAAAMLHPGFLAMLLHRCAWSLQRGGYSRLSKLAWRLNVTLTSCHIHPDAEIGPGLMLPHATGVVIGSGCKIGTRVTIYQNVTLGQNRRSEYPCIGDEAVLYPNCVVVGGIDVGKRAIIGANAFVRVSVGEGARVATLPAEADRTADLDSSFEKLECESFT